ncbi:MAG: hypothetical protein INH03_18910, partial [Rhodocyclaceae bacterium]|nr:hypothetical protein [Rhodocyclaceae bacterium]
ARGATGAIYVCINEVSEGARRFADEKGITIWQAGEVAHALHGLPMGGASGGATPGLSRT